MRTLSACFLLLLGSAAASAQAPPDAKGTAPLTQNQNDLRDAAAAQIELLTRQNALLSQVIAQNARGLVTYPIAFALPGPINCQGDCRATVATLCRTVRYPNSATYPAIVTGDAIGVYVNGVCYGP